MRNTSRIEFIGYDSGWGCGNYGCEDAPYHLAMDQVMQAVAATGCDPHWLGPLGVKHLALHADHDSKDKTLPFVITALRRLYGATRRICENGHLPVVIGGDHSSAIGTWAGVVGAKKCAGNFGLIWIDAHLDCHTYETSHQGKFGGWWHGQPVAALTGHGLPALTSIGGDVAKISPAHISIIGAHSYEPAELEFVTKHGIRVYFLEEVQQRGFDAVFREAVARATKGTAGFGLSIDMDAFRPEDSPGVGTREETGLAAADVLPIIRGVARHPDFCALEIVEFNPHQDTGRRTENLLIALIKSLFSAANA